MRARACLILGLAAAGACTTGTDDLHPGEQRDGGSAPVDAAAGDASPRSDAGSPEELAAALTAAQCRFDARCLPLYFFEHFGSEDACASAGAQGLGPRVATLLESNRARLDPAALAACLEALQQGSCTESATWLACADVVVGTVPRGAVCSRSDECAPGTRCQARDLCGTCVDAIPNGGSCDEMLHNACASGMCYTRIANTPAFCVPTNLREGEACSGNYSDCAPPLFCERTAPGEGGHCVPPPHVGDACFSPPPGVAPCDFQIARCDHGVCRALTFVAPGESCDLGSVCHGPCRQGICQPAGALGEPCEGIGSDCGSGAGRCDGDFICRPLLTEGEPCSIADQCATGLDCAGSPLRCTAHPWDFCP